MIYRVRHVTRLAYSAPVANARFNLRLVPRLWLGQTMLSQSLSLDPLPTIERQSLGPYWVRTTQAGFEYQIESLEIASEFTTGVAPALPGGGGPTIRALRAEALADRKLHDLSPAPYIFESRIARQSPMIGAWGTAYLNDDEAIVPAASALMEALHGEFDYVPGATDSGTEPDQAFAARNGVCQDFAHVMIIALRSAGIPSAYVSGYLLTVPPPGKPKLVGADAMHAWVNVWCGAEIGWVGFDPTNNCLVATDHIPIGMGRDYADVSPVDGTFIGSAPQRISTSVDVDVVE